MVVISPDFANSFFASSTACASSTAFSLLRNFFSSTPLSTLLHVHLCLRSTPSFSGTPGKKRKKSVDSAITPSRCNSTCATVSIVVQIHYIQKQFSVLSSRDHRILGATQRFLRCLSGIMTSWRGSSGPYDSWHVRRYHINTPPRAYQARSRTKHFRRQSSITWLACDVGGEGAQ